MRFCLRTSLDHMNFSEDITKIIHHFPLERADKLKLRVKSKDNLYFNFLIFIRSILMI